MQNKLFNSPIYSSIMMEHIWNMINAMLDNNIEFRLLCYKKSISFKPELPEFITDDMGDMVIFDISNYSFESAILSGEEFYFGAGFGSENIGATVKVPLLSIAQMFLEDIPIMLNFATHKQTKKDKIDNSMSALLNNPKNQHLLKKRKR